MKKFVLIAAAAVALAASAITPASAGFKGCCGGWTGGHHWGGGWGGGLSIGVGLDSGYGYVGNGGDCYYVRREVLVPNIGLVSRRQLVCE
jgi:hypothetical protein